MPLRVAFLIERFDPARGGMETSAAEFLTEMAPLGPELHVVTQSGVEHFPAARVHALGRSGMGRSGRYRAFAKRAAEFVGAGQWDVVHAVTPCLDCSLYQPRAGTAREALARTIAVRRSGLARWARRMAAQFNLKGRLLERLERELLCRPDPPLVAALSSYMRRQLMEAYQLPADRVRDVFNGVTVELPPAEERQRIRQQLREQLGLGPGQLAAIFVAHNFRRKGLLRLLESLNQPGAQEWQLLVVGKDRPATYQQAAERLGVAARVHFLGARRDVRQLYLAADAAVLPSYYDPCSRTILEALSLGLPAIATRYDGSSDCIVNGQSGFVISSPDDVSALAAALQQLSDPQKRAPAAAAALALRERLSMHRHAREIFALYEEIQARPATRQV